MSKVIPAFNGLLLAIIVWLATSSIIQADAMAQVETRIAIDGSANDWAGRAVVNVDPVGDGESGFLDWAAGYAFINQHALYLLMATADPNALWVQVDLAFQVGAQRLLISWKPGQTNGYVGDVTATYQPIGPTAYSTFAFGPALEARIDLRDLGSPTSLDLIEVNAMVGVCCEIGAWRAADRWQPGGPIPHVAEVDPPRLISNEPAYVLARAFRLPEPYIAQRLFAPPVPELIGIARSQSGIVFLQQGTLLDPGLSVLDPANGQVRRILDLPSQAAWYNGLVGGPGDTVFLAVRNEIWQVHPDGQHQVWSQRRDGSPRYYTADGRLLGYSNDSTRLLQLFPDGSAWEIASGFGQIYDLVATADGTVFVSDFQTGDIVRVAPDGQRRVLVAHVLMRDPLDLGLDPAGRLFLMSTASGFVEIDTDSGSLTRHDAAWSPCTIHPADFVFTGPDQVLFLDPTMSQITWTDLKTGQNGLLVSNQGANTAAAAIGPDDALYVGRWGCGKALPAQVVRVGDDGARTVYVDNLRGQVRDIAFAPNGDLYVATFAIKPGANASHHLFYVPITGGKRRSIPVTGMDILSLAVDPISGHLLATEYGRSSILELSRQGLLARYPIQFPQAVSECQLDVANTGAVYAYCSESARQWSGPVVERWVLRLDPASGFTETLFQFDHPGCCVMGNLSVDFQGVPWSLMGPEFQIYRVNPIGEAELFAQNLPIDPMAVVVDRQGDVYFTSSSGIYRVYRDH